MMRVAMVNTARERGGAARMAALLAQTLHNHFDDVQATLYHCEDQRRTPPFHGLKRPLSRPLNALLARLGGSTWVCDMGVAQDIIEKTREADLLHIHNLHGYYLNYPKLLQAWQDRPVVWTLHDMWGLTGRCGFSHLCVYWKKGCEYCPHKDYYPRSWIDRARHEFKIKTALFSGLNRLSIVSPSQWLADLAVERGFAQEKVHVIPNPVNTNSLRVIDKETARNTLNLPKKEFIALFVAADCGDSRKGYRDFAQIIKATRCMGIAVGKPPVTPETMIQHTGQISSRDLISQYYCAADVYIIPSYADNYPNTVIESLICGTPVIGYNEGGIPSQLDLPYCQLVKKGDLTSLVNSVGTLINGGGKNTEIRLDLNQKAVIRWAPITITEQYLVVFKQATEQ
jgi:putative colanic acid biosynthesis glycosyltransferase WcaC